MDEVQIVVWGDENKLPPSLVDFARREFEKVCFKAPVTVSEAKANPVVESVEDVSFLLTFEWFMFESEAVMCLLHSRTPDNILEQARVVAGNNPNITVFFAYQETDGGKWFYKSLIP